MAALAAQPFGRFGLRCRVAFTDAESEAETEIPAEGEAQQALVRQAHARAHPSLRLASGILSISFTSALPRPWLTATPARLARFRGMTGWRTGMARFCRDAAAATHVEYGLLLGVAAGAGLALSLLGSQLNENLTQIVSALSQNFKTSN